MSVCFPKNSPVESSLFRSDDCSTFWTTFRVWIRWGAIVLSLTAVLAAVLTLIPKAVPPQLLTIENAPFKIEITTGGSLEPLRTERAISLCQWTVQILSRVPEGTWVQKGDIVCVLDSSEIEEFRRAREVSLIKAQSSLEASRQQEEIIRAANERRLAEAEHLRQNAEMDLFEYTSGTHPNATMISALTRIDCGPLSMTCSLRNACGCWDTQAIPRLLWSHSKPQLNQNNCGDWRLRRIFWRSILTRGRMF